MKILLTGASGTLGTELCEQLEGYDIPFVRLDPEIDIRNYGEVESAIFGAGCQVVIHCAAFTDTMRCETERDLAYGVNVRGTANVAQICYELDKFMVHISTDYVYRGDKSYTGDGRQGNYEIHDRLDPINYYSFTKTAADLTVRGILSYDRHLIVRTSFKKKGPWPYPKAFVDQHTSRDTVDVIANQILQATIGGHTGIVHLGTERKTVFELAQRQSPNVQPISRKDIKGVIIPKDTSLKLTDIRKVL